MAEEPLLLVETVTQQEEQVVLVEVDPLYFRPNEVHCLLGNATKARQQLGWKPRIGFRQLVQEMVRSDVNTMRSGRNEETRQVAKF